MQVLVTGGTGFTGSHLVRRLLERGHQVRVLDHAQQELGYAPKVDLQTGLGITARWYQDHKYL